MVFKKPSRIFVAFFLSFSLTLIVPICILAVVYQRMSVRLEAEITAHNRDVLEQCATTVDNAFGMIEHTVTSYAFHKDVHEYIKDGRSYAASPSLGKTKNAYQIIESQTDLLRYNNILEILLYARDSDSIVSMKTAYSPFPYYQYLLEYPGGGEALKDMLLHSPGGGVFLPEAPITLFDRPYRAIAYFQPIQINYSVSNLGCIAAFLDTAQIDRHMDQLNLGETGVFYIADRDGSILYQRPGIEGAATVSDLDLDLSRFMTLTVEKPGLRHTYTVHIPYEAVYSQISYLKQLIFFLIVIELVVGIAFALLLAYQNVRPIMDLFQILPDKGPEIRRDFVYLKGSISTLVSGNQNLSKELAVQAPIVRSDFIRNLLQGSFADEAAILERGRHVNCDFRGAAYSVLLVLNTGYGGELDREELDELESSRILVNQLLSESTVFRSYSFTRSEREEVCLLCFDEPDPEACATLLRESVREMDGILRNELKVPLQYLCGGFCHSLEDAPNLYAKLKQAARSDYFIGSKGELIFPDRPVSGGAFYPLDEESKLIKTVLTGRRDKIPAILEELYRENIVRRGISETDLSFLHAGLHMTCMRLSNTVPGLLEESDIAFLLLPASLEEAEACRLRAVSLFGGLCDRVLAGKQSEEDKANSEIIAFMRENMSQSGFTLYHVAERFGYSESYLYKLFRKSFGCTFSAMLERLRIEEACRLLQEGDSPIEAVAASIGYNSGHTFRRVFKKAVGVLPSDYRA